MGAKLVLFAVVAWSCAAAQFGGAADDSRGYIPAWPYCSKTDNYTMNSQYQMNLNQLLNSLPIEAKKNGGFYKASFGAAPDEIFALIMCYSYRSWTQCENCLYAAANGITLFCPYSRTVDAVYDTCLLRYSNAFFFSAANTKVAFYFLKGYTDPSSMDAARRKLMGQLTEDAAGSPSPLRTANRSLAYKDSQGSPQVIYGMAQCTRDLNASECIRCLTSIVDQCLSTSPTAAMAASSVTAATSCTPYQSSMSSSLRRRRRNRLLSPLLSIPHHRQ
ncbi:hypothetical protein ABZP36_010080 [Zizania latifolia]